MENTKLRGAAALDAYIELLDPIFEVASDEALIDMAEKGASTMQWLCEAVRRHRGTFIKVLALVEDKDPEELDFFGVIEGMDGLLDNKTLRSLFLPQSRKNRKSSGSASENTEVHGQ